MTASVDRHDEPVLQLRNAYIGYGDRPVVTALDLDVRRHEVVALLGANGSGKSTVCKGLLGLASVLGGSVQLFGVPAERFRDRHRIGYVPQQHTVTGAIPSTVREVVASGRIRRRGLRPTSTRDRAAIEWALDEVGLGDRARVPLVELSGGQQRRVLIARALASEPDVLVMDEPTAGVDADNQAVLARTLRRLVDSGLTLVVVTHEVAPFADLVTRGVVMRGGQKVYDGPVSDALLHSTDDGHAHVHGDEPRPGGFGLTG